MTIKEAPPSPWGVVLNSDGFVQKVTYEGKLIGRVKRASLRSEETVESLELPILALEIVGPINVEVDHSLPKLARFVEDS